MREKNQIPKKSGFEVPKGYFESTDRVLKDRIALEKVLGTIEHSQPFTVPDTYFDTNLSDIKDRISLEEVIPTPQDGFEVPDGYFESLSSRVSVDTLSRKRDQIQETPKKTGKLVILKRYVYPAITVAASLVLLFSVIYSQRPAVTTENLELATITEYIDEHDTIFYEADIEDLLSEDDLESLESDIALEETLLIDYLDDRVESYDLYIQ